MKIIVKKVLIALVIGMLIMLVGLAGDLDHDEYIEANSTPKAKFIN